MKFSLTVDSPREAGYATFMFQALQGAMTADPPPYSPPKACSGVSHTALLAGLQEGGTSDPDDDGEETGTGADAGGGTPAGKKRGRKSQAQKDAEAAAAKAAAEHALKPGDALKGVNAQTLAAALQGMPLVHESEGTQVRVAPGTPLDEIEAMRARLQAQDAEIKAKEEAAKKAEDDKKKEDDAALAAKADQAAMAARIAKDAAMAATAAKAAETPPAAGDDLLASLFAKNKAETAEPGLADLSGPQLRNAFIKYINGEGGLFWARGVMAHYGLHSLDDLTDVQTREALQDPGKIKKIEL
jgi:hypothetical protein